MEVAEIAQEGDKWHSSVKYKKQEKCDSLMYDYKMLFPHFAGIFNKYWKWVSD